MHCKGGHGRSAAVAAAWLIHSEQLSPQAAQRRLSSVRRVRKTLDKQPNLLGFYRKHGDSVPGSGEGSSGAGAELGDTDGDISNKCRSE